MQSSKTYFQIPVNEFNTWGLQKLQEVFKNYIDNTEKATSAAYLHTVLTIFSVETLSGLKHDLDLYTGFIRNDYTSAFKDNKSLDFQNRIDLTWDLYRTTVKNLVAPIVPVDQGKAYTADFVDSNTLQISEVSIAELKDTVTEIF